MTSKKNFFINLLYLISTIAAGVFIAILSLNSLLPNLHRFGLISLILLVYLAIGILIIKRPRDAKVFYFSAFILSIFTIIFVFGAYYIQNTYSKYNLRLNDSKKEILEYSVITRKDNPVNSIAELRGDTIYYDKTDKEREIKIIEDAILKNNNSVKFEEGTNTLDLAKDLMSAKIDYMILNKSKLAMIIEQSNDFEEKHKVLAVNSKDNSFKLHRNIDDISKGVEAGESFNIFVTGSDTRTSLYENTRSDVNILVTINPKTHKILITSLPRDSYVEMTGLGKDKLTHAGAYGIKTLVSTVENLLDIDINYYAKVNFSSFEEIIDILGGITVYNDQAFTAISDDYYPKGQIELSGKRALNFVRERKAFVDGDFARGRHQMLVLEAMMKKAMSPSILLSYNSLLDTVLSNVNTNLPTNKITEMINTQIAKMPTWDIKQYQLQGEPVMGLPSYAMPGFNLSMIQLSFESVEESKELIKATLLGN
ncbi:LCP family protein [uncultured Helcococcus sp.]|uniref:LCP family protein n=1 Tax=uncultured Helcococcus sp. TaxID=1072508 RepID=UPI00261385AC|nr:LCP family protein [uncultured Helcococcus sp.]